MEAMKTKFDEVLAQVSEPDEMYGKYLAADVIREWEDNVIDDETGLAIDIPCQELIMAAGTKLDADTIPQLMFYISTGDIKSVKVSNVQRTGRYMLMNRASLWMLTISSKAYGRSQSTKLVLSAQCLEHAIMIARDYLEQYISGTFTINMAKAHSDCVLVPYETLTDVNVDDAGNVSEVCPAPQASCYYSLLADVTIDGETLCYEWLVVAASVDDARSRICGYLEQKQREAGAEHETEVTVLSGTKSNIGFVVPKEFTDSYYQNMSR